MLTLVSNLIESHVREEIIASVYQYLSIHIYIILYRNKLPECNN